MDEKEKQTAEEQERLEAVPEEKPEEKVEASEAKEDAEAKAPKEAKPEEKPEEKAEEKAEASEAKAEAEAKEPEEKEQEEPEAKAEELSAREKEAELKCALALAGVEKGRLKYALRLLDKEAVKNEATAESQVEELKAAFPELFKQPAGLGSEGSFKRTQESAEESARQIFAKALL